MQIPNTQLIKYLLGTLNEREDREISLRIVENKTFENEMLLAESELIEAFLEKTLTPEETKLFYVNFLTTEDRENQLKEIYLLKKYAANNSRQKEFAGIQKVNSPGFVDKSKAFFLVNLKPVPAILAILIVVLVIGATWRVFFTKPDVELTQLEKQYAEINRQDLRNSPELAISPVVLIPGVLRSDDPSSKVETSKIGDKVFFRLGLLVEIKGKEFLKAELVKDKKTIFTQNEARIYKNQNGQEVKLILPKSVLEKGQYQVKLENPNSEKSPFSYIFVVE
jgi:hypothetical protein